MKKTAPFEFELRPASADDADFLFRLYASTRTDELDAAAFPAEMREPFLRMQHAAQTTHYSRTYPEAVHRVIMDGEVRIGRELVHRDADGILLVDVAILPAYCGRGIGTSLLDSLMKECSSNGRPLRLHVFKMNENAYRRYIRLGFRVVSDDGMYLSMEWTSADAKQSAA